MVAYVARALAIALLLAGNVLGSGPLVAEDALLAAVDRLVERNGVTADGPGVAILVVEPGRVLVKKGYGLADLDKQSPITPRTMFELASVSKTFSATAILILHDRGKLSVDDDVRDYLPELPEYRSGPIRIRDLLHHTSGLPDYMDIENVPARHKTYWVNEDYADQFAKQRRQFPLTFATGQKYEYNNTNYMLLGLIIARVGKKSYGDFLRDEIFTPAGMKHTFVYENPDSVPAVTGGCNRAIGYERGKKNPWRAAWGAPPARREQFLTVGDGGVWTNLEDMAAWDTALRGKILVKPATMQQALKPSNTRDGERNDYGFGWELFFDEGKLIGYGHEGYWGGFNTSYYQYLEADRTTVILSNRGNFDPDKFWYPLNAAIEKHHP